MVKDDEYNQLCEMEKEFLVVDVQMRMLHSRTHDKTTSND